MRHPYYTDVSKSRLANIETDKAVKEISGEFRQGLISRAEAIAMLRYVGAFEAEIQEAL